MSMTTEDGEEKPFLAAGGHEDEEEELDYQDDVSVPRNKKKDVVERKTHGILFILQIAFLALNLTFLAWNLRSHKNSDGDELEGIYTPAQQALHYTVGEMNPARGPSPYVGEPRPEVDQAWSELLQGGIIELSKDELRTLNKTSIQLKESGGYIGYLETIHMLHCVKRIYQSQYPESYPELQATDAFDPGHWDHCLEVLRQGIMCNADLTVNTYYWKGPDEIQGDRRGTRKCTDWSRIHEWAVGRAVKFEGHEKFRETLVKTLPEEESS